MEQSKILKDFLYHVLVCDGSEYKELQDNNNAIGFAQYYIQGNEISNASKDAKECIQSIFGSLFLWRSYILGRPKDGGSIQDMLTKEYELVPLEIAYHIFMCRVKSINSSLLELTSNLSKVMQRQAQPDQFITIANLAYQHIGRTMYLVNILDTMSFRNSELKNAQKISPHFQALIQYFNRLYKEGNTIVSGGGQNLKQSIDNYQNGLAAIKKLLESLHKYTKECIKSLTKCFSHINLSDDQFNLISNFNLEFNPVISVVFSVLECATINSQNLESAISQVKELLNDLAEASGRSYKGFRGKDYDGAIDTISSKTDSALKTMSSLVKFMEELFTQNQFYKSIYSDSLKNDYSTFESIIPKIKNLLDSTITKPVEAAAPPLPNLPTLPNIGMPTLSPIAEPKLDFEVPENGFWKESEAGSRTISAMRIASRIAKSALFGESVDIDCECLVKELASLDSVMDLAQKSAADENEKSSVSLGREFVSICISEFSDSLTKFRASNGKVYIKLSFIASVLKLIAAIGGSVFDPRTLKFVFDGIETAIAALSQACGQIAQPFLESCTQVFGALQGQADPTIMVYLKALEASYKLLLEGDKLSRQFSDITQAFDITGIMQAVDAVAPSLEAAGSAVLDVNGKLHYDYINLVYDGCVAVPHLRKAFLLLFKAGLVGSVRASATAFGDAFSAAEFVFGKLGKSSSEFNIISGAVWDRTKTIIGPICRQLSFYSLPIDSLTSLLTQQQQAIGTLINAIEATPGMKRHVEALDASKSLLSYLRALSPAADLKGQLLAPKLIGSLIADNLASVVKSSQDAMAFGDSPEAGKHLMAAAIAIANMCASSGLVPNMGPTLRPFEQARAAVCDQLVQARTANPGARGGALRTLNTLYEQQIGALAQNAIAMKGSAAQSVEVIPPTPPKVRSDVKAKLKKPSFDFFVDNGAEEDERQRKEIEENRKEQERKEEEERLRKEEEERLDTVEKVMSILADSPQSPSGQPRFVCDIRHHIDTLLALIARMQQVPGNTEHSNAVLALLQSMKQHIGVADAYYAN